MQRQFGKVKTLALTQARDETHHYIDYIKWRLQSLALSTQYNRFQSKYKLSPLATLKVMLTHLLPLRSLAFHPKHSIVLTS